MPRHSAIKLSKFWGVPWVSKWFEQQHQVMSNQNYSRAAAQKFERDILQIQKLGQFDGRMTWHQRSINLLHVTLPASCPSFRVSLRLLKRFEQQHQVMSNQNYSRAAAQSLRWSIYKTQNLDNSLAE